MATSPAPDAAAPPGMCPGIAVLGGGGAGGDGDGDGSGDLPASMKADESLRFEWSVRALAQEAETQMTLFPSFACVADELALEFEECLIGFTAAGRLSALHVDQSRLLTELDAKLTAMSGPLHASLWTDEAMRVAPEWADLRAAAKALLDAMGWSRLPPPGERYLYVGPYA